jgi:two-component system, LuxR family, response regulator FixJ
MIAGSHLVLVVDDDLAVRESFKFAFELEGLEVHACAGGVDLLGHPHLMRADCLVLDYHMPGMDGFAVLRALKARDCRVPVILITGNATAAVRHRAAIAGVRHVVEKPLLDSKLIESITDILNSRVRSACE